MQKFYCERHNLTMEVDGNTRKIVSGTRNVGGQICGLATAKVPSAGKLYIPDLSGNPTSRFCEVVEIGSESA